MTTTTNRSVGELTQALVAAMPVLDADEQSLALAIYDRLSRGQPVAPDVLASDVDRGSDDIEAILDRWPGVYRDGRTRIIGFWGLSLVEMPHRIRFEGTELYTWCAWDGLFIPELVDRAADVESQSPTSGEEIRLRVDRHGVSQVTPAGTVLSMLAPTTRFEPDVISSFCHLIHYFASPDDAEPWLTQHPGTFLLSLNDAFDLGRLTNRARFGTARALTTGGHATHR